MRMEVTVGTGTARTFASKEQTLIDGKLLAYPTKEKFVNLTDIATRAMVHTFPGEGPVALSPNGRISASGGCRGYVLWEVTTGNEVRSLIGTLGASDGIAFSTNGKFFTSAHYDGVKLWYAGDLTGQ